MKRAIGKLFIISGTSQVGKSTIAKKVTKLKKLNLLKIITTTTRKRRPDDKVATYQFVNKKTFMSMIKAGKFLEWAKVHTDYYGTPRKKVLDALKRGKNVILVIDVQGTAQIKKIMPEAITIFIKADSIIELKRRIFNSTHIPDGQKSARWHSTIKELKASKKYDYRVINYWGKLNRAVKDVEKVIIKHQ